MATSGGWYLPEITRCLWCGYVGAPALNTGPSSNNHYPLCCPRCAEINYVVDVNPNDPDEEFHKPAKPDAEDIICAKPGGPFFYLEERIADDWTELIVWMTKHSHWPVIWIVPPIEHRGRRRTTKSPNRPS